MADNISSHSEEPTTGVQELQRSTILAAYRERLHGANAGEAQQQVVRDFLERHWQTARVVGWSDLELFGCHPDPEFARVRWDCMGVVTLAAVTGAPIAEIHLDQIRYANGTTYRRKDLTRAVPIWMSLKLEQHHQPPHNR